MSRQRGHRTNKKADHKNRIPSPVDVVDGIPDRSPHPAAWKCLVIALIFAGWVAFLIYCAVAGGN